MEEAGKASVGDLLWGGSSPIYMVLEDDVEFSEHYFTNGLWSDLISKLRQSNEWDVMFLGTLDNHDVYGDETVFSAKDESTGALINVQRMSQEVRVWLVAKNEPRTWRAP